jgi:hypothetical protein
MDLSAAELRKLVIYDCETGVFTRRVASGYRGGHKAGIVLDSINSSNGYIRFSLNSTDFYGHRLAWLYHYGEWPKQQIDHINGIRTDNRICNLRDVLEIHNHQNLRGATAKSSTGVLGVSIVKSGKAKMQLTYTDNGRHCHISKTFNTIDEARAFYIEKKRLHHKGCTI